MQKDQTYSKVLDLVHSREDFNLIGSDLDLLNESLFETKNNNFDVVISSLIHKDLASLVLALVPNENRKKVLDNLRKELEKIRFMEISLAVKPSYKLVSSIFEYVNKNINQRISKACTFGKSKACPFRIAIDIKVDPSIIAGALISYEGRFFDGSLLKEIENELKNYV